jgi:D-lactate dehydrogenase (cytochrome)
MDLIDLLVGSEGTLGVTTEITLEAIPKVPTAMALLQCTSEEEALQLITELGNQEPEKRKSREPGGISAVEFIGENALKLLRKKGHAIADDVKSLLLVQAEIPDGDLTSLELLAETYKSDDFPIGMPNNPDTQKEFLALREAVPITVHEKVGELQSEKVGADPCVKPDRLPELMNIYYEEFGKAGIEVYAWGHGEGNFHFNVICPYEQLARAREIMVICGNRVIDELKGTMMAEHGTGKNAQKKGFLIKMFGEEGVNEMREVKKAFDPQGILSPGNMFEFSVQTS